MAVRVALGASHGRLAQQLLTESLLLAGIGGTAGLLVALGVTAALAPHLPPDLSRAAGMAGDVRILAFTALISLATGILFGLGPLVGMRRISAGESLKQSSRVAGASHSRLRNVLAVAQISLAIILLIGAGLMAKSFWALTHVSPGFRADRILTARLSLPRSRYPDNRRIAAFERELLETLSRKPGVQSAGLAMYLPLSALDNGWSFIVEGRPPLPVGMYNMAKYRPASAGYFETIGIPVLRGRSFTPADTADSPWVTVINESMAREYWGEQDPIGRRLQFGAETWRTVIGVVGECTARGTGRGDEARDVRADGAGAQYREWPHHRGPNGARYRCCRGRATRGRCGDRSGDPRGPDPDNEATGIGVGSAATFPHGDPGGVLDARTGDGVDRNLRGDELPGDSANARVRASG